MKSFIYTLNILFSGLLIIQGCGAGGTGNNNSIPSNPDTINLSSTSGDSEGPLLAFDATGYVYVGWKDLSPGKEGLYLSRSSDYGDSFNKEKISGTSLNDTLPKISTIGGERVDVLWSSSITGTMRYAFSIGDNPFTQPEIIMTDDRVVPSSLRMVSGTPNKIYSAYILSGDGQIDFKYFESPDIDSHPHVILKPSGASNPEISILPGGIADVVWDGSDGTIYFSRIKTELIPGQILVSRENSFSSGNPHCPEISHDSSGNIFVTWVDTSSGNEKIYFSRSTDSGQNFSIPIPISDTIHNASCPRMSVDEDSNIHIVWTQGAVGNQEIYYTRSPDLGISFSPPVNISQTDGNSSDPQIAIDSPSYVNVVWVEQSISQKDIYFAGSTNGGLSFSQDENLSNSRGDSTDPVIGATGNGYVYFAWVDDSVGNKEIYFRTGHGARGILSKLITPRLIRPVDGSYQITTSPIMEWTSIKEATSYQLQISTNRNFKTSIINETNLKDTNYTPSISLPGGNYYLRVRSGNGFTYSEWSSPINFRTESVPKDLNGDGYSDIVIGAPGAAQNRGKVYIYFGGGTLSTPVIISGGMPGDEFGTSISTGDVNGDGFSDLLVGATGVEGGIGRAYLFLGRSKEEWNRIADTSEADTIFSGNDFDYFGQSVSIEGDVDDDGYDDILIGAPYADGGMIDSGEVYLFYGGPILSSSYSASEGLTFQGRTMGDQFGYSVSFAGDINGDGYADILIGAPYADSGQTRLDSGRAYVYYGGDRIINFASEFTLNGERGSEFFGRATSGAGDINRDGFSDLLIGGDSGGLGTGRVYLYYGGTMWENGSPVIIEGIEKDKFGSSIAQVSDVNNMGYDDILIGAPWGGFYRQGTVYLFTGEQIRNKAGYPNISAKSADLILNGSENQGEFGIDVAGAGYADSDRIADWMVGAHLAGTGDTGLVYFYSGGNLLIPVPLIISGDAQYDQFGYTLYKNTLP